MIANDPVRRWEWLVPILFWPVMLMIILIVLEALNEFGYMMGLIHLQLAIQVGSPEPFPSPVGFFSFILTSPEWVRMFFYAYAPGPFDSYPLWLLIGSFSSLFIVFVALSVVAGYFLFPHSRTGSLIFAMVAFSLFYVAREIIWLFDSVLIWALDVMIPWQVNTLIALLYYGVFFSLLLSFIWLSLRPSFGRITKRGAFG